MHRRYKILLITAVATFMVFLDVTIVNVAFPDIERDFAGTSLASLSWILNAYNIVFAALLVPAGRLADRVGRRRAFLAGISGFVATSVLCGLAPDVTTLVIARVLQAVAGAVLVPSSLGLLIPEFPLERRATATALWGASGAVAAAVGPSLGGVLVDQAGWRWIFFINVGIGLAALVPARRLLREHETTTGPLPDALAVVLLVIGVGLVSLGIVKAPDWGFGSAQTLAAVAAGAAILVAFARRSAGHPAPVIELSLFRIRSFAVASGGLFLFSLGFYALLLGNILFLTSVWQYSIVKAGFAVTPGPLMAALSAGLGGRLSDRFGQRVVAVPGGISFALGCAWFAAHASADVAYATDFLPGMVLTGIGVGFVFSALGSAAVAELPPARFSTGGAVSACARQLGAVLGIAVLVAILQDATPANVVDRAQLTWILEGSAALGCALVALGLGRVRAALPDQPFAPASTHSVANVGSLAP